MIKDLRKIENLHVAFWLVKDACWCLLFRPLGMVMIFPTLIVSIWLTWNSRNEPKDLFHNIAITFWICANATWMTGEFYFNDHLRPFAMVFFSLGLLVVAFYYLFIAHKISDKEELISQ